MFSRINELPGQGCTDPGDLPTATLQNPADGENGPDGCLVTRPTGQELLEGVAIV